MTRVVLMQRAKRHSQRLAFEVKRENRKNMLEASVDAVAREHFHQRRLLVRDDLVVEVFVRDGVEYLFSDFDLALNGFDDLLAGDRDIGVRVGEPQERLAALV